ncbi:hypothetical protein SAMN05660489_00811 [Pseudomonas sp. LAMO17WK12:I10]|uniref:DUF6279 family lipoprotein n=1 Tax=unclassified Pseudomonas TaxID=196821 RepID=UPI000BC64057|nr:MULTISPECIES: DUF6279 family lipoprotein [unclassified Pseudomonas]PXX75405.1 hypothetical protein H160_00605 [Pseudomonas sp. LAMO17WK12:I9]SNY14682.1 hypothetical protein SAMN05660489_00811 [Pseudomonas sp. LAMO17WK12:I10]
MSRRLQHLTLLLLLSLVLTSCNRVGLAYRNLDVIIPWTLNDYLEMNREQKIWFNQRLKEHLSWHCSTQLPGYLDYLDRLQQMVARNQVNDAELQELTRGAKQAIAQTARAIAPSAIELLRGLDDQQVAEMKAAFAKDMRQRRSKYLKPPLEQQIRLRAERMDKRLNTWLGALTPEQTQRVTDWSTSLGEQNQLWLANRANWQAQFSAALEQRQNSDFDRRIERLLVDRESFWTPAYRQAYTNSEQAMRSLLVDVMANSTPAQREHLRNKLQNVRDEFEALKCMKKVRQE